MPWQLFRRAHRAGTAGWINIVSYHNLMVSWLLLPVDDYATLVCSVATVLTMVIELNLAFRSRMFAEVYAYYQLYSSYEEWSYIAE